MKANYPYIQDIYIYCTINRQFLQVENGELLSNMHNFSGYQINRIKSGLCRSMLTHFSRHRRQWKRQPRHFLLNKNGLYRTVCKDQIKTKSRFYKKESPANNVFTPFAGDRLVPLTGLEPVPHFCEGILSPSCLPISPQRLIILHQLN